MTNSKEPEEFVRKIQEDTRRYVEALLKETERLRLLVRSTEQEKEALHRELDELRGRLQRQEQSHRALQDELEAIQQESARFAEDFAIVEQQHNDLATLYIAGFRLGGTLEREELLATIKEIVTNLIGSDQVSVYERQDESTLTCVAASGLEPEATPVIDLERDPLGTLARRREPVLVGRDDELDARAKDAGVSACVPLWVGDELVGAVFIHRLLPQKEAFAEVDDQLVDLLARQGAVALRCSALLARHK